MSISKRLLGMASSEPSKSAALQRTPWLRRARIVVAGLLGWSMVAAAPSATAQTPVPPHWIAYAQLASGQLQGWMADQANGSDMAMHKGGQKYLDASEAGEGATPHVG